MKPETIAAIERHYDHARAKHPYFADVLVPYDHLIRSETLLRRQRLFLDEEIANEKADALSVAAVEEAELAAAIAKGDTAAAIEEAYDTIAVYLRIIDVLNGSQPLGNPDNAPDGAYPTLTFEVEMKGPAQ